MTYTPYSETDDETTAYRFVGTYLRLPGDRMTLDRGDEVRLPDRVANPIDDLLEPIGEAVDGSTEDTADESDAEDAESGSEDTATEASESESDTDSDDDVASGDGLVDVDSYETPDAFPGDVPDAESWEWDALQEASKANGVNAAQSKTDQIEELRSIGNQ